MSNERRLRVLIGKPGLDGHDRGALVVARALRDAGFEVIYSGLHQTPDALARVAIQEAADCIGVSILSGAHNTLLPKIVAELASQGAPEIFVFAGGVIPEDDIPGLEEAGVQAVFGPGTSTKAIVAWLREQATSRSTQLDYS